MQLLNFLMPLIPTDKPNHLLGIADITSILQAAPYGIDTFDSCYPTRWVPQALGRCILLTVFP